ncbi:unnamed protein product [Cuscuta campestris]|uniref:Uncharacterized protein n=1 Tax=Cuscuta campestris TaxID=132261 RepID=A0A484NM37_9ASTE|nr:unnamed protein product [Cuscuta campestris]
MAKLGNFLDVPNKRSILEMIQRDFQDFAGIIVEVLEMPGHPVGDCGDLSKFIAALQETSVASVEEARILLDTPMFYTTLEGLNLLEKLHMTIFDKKLFEPTEIQNAIFNLHGTGDCCEKLLDWPTRYQKSTLFSKGGKFKIPNQSAPRVDIIRLLRNILEHNEGRSGRFCTYKSFREEFGDIIGELRGVLFYMLNKDSTFDRHEIHTIKMFFDSSVTRNDDVEVSSILLQRMAKTAPPQPAGTSTLTGRRLNHRSGGMAAGAAGYCAAYSRGASPATTPTSNAAPITRTAAAPCTNRAAEEATVAPIRRPTCLTPSGAPGARAVWLWLWPPPDRLLRAALPPPQSRGRDTNLWSFLSKKKNNNMNSTASRRRQ